MLKESKKYKFTLIFILVLLLLIIYPSLVYSQPGLNSTINNNTSVGNSSNSEGFKIPKLPFVEQTDNPEDVGSALSLIIILTILSLAPSIIILFTSFIRIAIVFSFTRTALATQQVPPNQVIYGLALILTFFIMAPTFTQIYENAYLPYQNEDLTLEEFGERALEPIREFMGKQIYGSSNGMRSLKLFVELANMPDPKTPEDIPTHVLVPAFVLNELTRAFTMGVLIFIPFIIIDLVVASILLSIGIIFLPPVIVSLPIKIILFVLVDGWNFLVEGLIKSFL